MAQRMRLSRFYLCLMVLSAGATQFGGVDETRGQPQMAMPVGVVPARKMAVTSTLPLVGTVRPYTRSIIASEVQGIVEELKVEEGDRVEAGQVICRLRVTVRKLALAEAEATGMRLGQELAELKAGSRPEDIAQARAAMEEARAVSQKWAGELQRIHKLIGQGSAAEKELNDVMADSKAAAERLAHATAAHDLAVAGPRKEQIARAEFAVEAAKVVAERLRYDISQSEIRAPFTGYVTHKHTERGAWMASGGPVVELIDLERLLVRVDVPESAIRGARIGSQCAVVVDALGRTFRGPIKHVIPQADEKARTFPIEIELANSDHELKSGMFARVRVPAGPTVESVIVPRDAVIQRGETQYVVMVGPAPPPAEGTFAVPVPVQLGADVGAWIVVNSPALQQGVSVAVKGQDRVFGPQPVQPLPAVVPEPQMPGVPGSQPSSAPAKDIAKGHS